MLLYEACLNHMIEKLRREMVGLALERGSLLDPSVIEISQRLDVYIVRLQRLMKNRSKYHGKRVVNLTIGDTNVTVRTVAGLTMKFRKFNKLA